MKFKGEDFVLSLRKWTGGGQFNTTTDLQTLYRLNQLIDK